MPNFKDRVYLQQKISNLPNMKILNTQQIREWDAYTIENVPILSTDLMERASQQLFFWIASHYKNDSAFIIFSGTGNNGGDALALARILFNEGYVNLKVFLLKIGTKLSTDCEKNLDRLKRIQHIEVIEIEEGDDFPEIAPFEIAIDGIFGSGLSRPISGYWGELIKHINNTTTDIVAIDLPSGLFAENNIGNVGVKIKACTTLTFQVAKRALFFAENHAYSGNWYVLDIGLHANYLNNSETNYYFTQWEDANRLLHVRKTFDHKGTYGHAFLIAGSYGKIGAAVLSAKAVLRSGSGLVTVHVPETGREIMQTAVPEAMVCIDESEMNYCEAKMLNAYTAVGIGPGIGKKKSMQNALKRILENSSKPIVFDADALNILAENKEWLHLIPKDAVLTPHPGEFDRLTQKHSSGFERCETQLQFSKQYQVIVVLKGAFTSITDTCGNVFFNSTGNPGMATGGSGDVLTGIILSLLAQGYKPIEAARFGVFLHGLAGDLAAEKVGFEALIASDIINNLGCAFKRIKKE
jgi:NAD(P)H-hydrate epimerase